MINHACKGMMHSHAKTVFKKENAFKEDPATVQVNYISLKQYKHQGKCMQKGEENRPGGRRRSCNAVEGCWRDYQCCRLFQLFLPYSLFVSWVLTSAIFVSPSPTGSCTSFVPAADLICQKKWSQDQQVVPAGLWFLFSFPFFPLLSLLLSIFPTSQQHFPPAGVRREKNVRVPKVLAAGALGKKHLHILFCRKWNKRPRNSSRVPPDGRKQWRWSCDVLVESILLLFLVFPAACLSFSPSFVFLLILFSTPFYVFFSAVFTFLSRSLEGLYIV